MIWFWIEWHSPTKLLLWCKLILIKRSITLSRQSLLVQTLLYDSVSPVNEHVRLNVEQLHSAKVVSPFNLISLLWCVCCLVSISGVLIMVSLIQLSKLLCFLNFVNTPLWWARSKFACLFAYHEFTLFTPVMLRKSQLSLKSTKQVMRTACISLNPSTCLFCWSNWPHPL